MNHPVWESMSCAERIYVGNRLADGDISRFCPIKKVDWFNIKLQNGGRVSGAYAWGSASGEFIRLRYFAR
jgi:hypothetical protein